MVLVPPDAAIRLRTQVESELRAPVQPLQPLRGIPAELPELQRGQTFTAQIREALPNNTYRALVAGRQLTLELPEGAQAGDELELVVVDRSDRVILARRVDAGTSATRSAEAYPFAKISPAARQIAQLLPAEGETAAPAPLSRGQPLLAAPPSTPAATAALAHALGRAASESGVFYEAHLAQWVAGQRPLADLMREPHARLAAPPAEMPAPPAKVGADETAPSAGREAPSAPAPRPIPEELRPLVQQQLEALAHQRLVWQGELWPRQTLEWEVEWQEDAGSRGGAEEETPWRTRLALTLPRLGPIDARLLVSAQGIRIALTTESHASANQLRAAAASLAAAFSAAGLALLAFDVATHDEHAAGQG